MTFAYVGEIAPTEEAVVREEPVAPATALEAEMQRNVEAMEAREPQSPEEEALIRSTLGQTKRLLAELRGVAGTRSRLLGRSRPRSERRLLLLNREKRLQKRSQTCSQRQNDEHQPERQWPPLLATSSLALWESANGAGAQMSKRTQTSLRRQNFLS
jgi:hypothetical protein